MTKDVRCVYGSLWFCVSFSRAASLKVAMPSALLIEATTALQTQSHRDKSTLVASADLHSLSLGCCWSPWSCGSPRSLSWATAHTLAGLSGELGSKRNFMPGKMWAQISNSPHGTVFDDLELITLPLSQIPDFSNQMTALRIKTGREK